MSMTHLHTFDANDPRTLITWHGKAYRAVKLYRDGEGDVWVFIIRRTKRGTDFKNGEGLSLTLTGSLDQRGEGRALAAYIREIISSAQQEHNATDEDECTECGHLGTGQVPGCPCRGCDVLWCAT